MHIKTFTLSLLAFSLTCKAADEEAGQASKHIEMPVWMANKDLPREALTALDNYKQELKDCIRAKGDRPLRSSAPIRACIHVWRNEHPGPLPETLQELIEGAKPTIEKDVRKLQGITSDLKKNNNKYNERRLFLFINGMEAAAITLSTCVFALIREALEEAMSSSSEAS